jgi:wyosine [tRNA(Phe)-imidazoG37] synthetase (radical SAM superfamily)
MVLPIKTGIIYGPVDSRRLGKSLGINLTPHRKKYCDFDCLYCHYGRTVYHKYTPDVDDVFPAIDEVLAEVEKFLKSDIEFNYLTFSGNGEPTLHPEFTTITRECKVLARKHRPYVKLTLLSNSTTCGQSRIIEALSIIDLPIMKLDAGTEELFTRINRPVPEITFKSIIDNLVALDNITIQALLLAGDPDNSTPEAIAAWYDCLTKIKPNDIQIYTLDRPFAAKNADGEVRIHKVDDGRMNEIVEIGRNRYGLNISRY